MESKSAQLESEVNQTSNEFETTSTTIEENLKPQNLIIATDAPTATVVNPITTEEATITDLAEERGALCIASDTTTTGVLIPIESDEIIDTELTEAFGGFLKTFILTSRNKFYDLDIYITHLRPKIITTLTEEVEKQRGVKAFISLYPMYKEFKPEGRKIPGTLSGKVIIAKNKFEVLAGVDRAFRHLRRLHEQFKPVVSCIHFEEITTLKLDIARYNPRG